jgi:ATP-binding protein involved in chromosome partitioning
LSTRLGYRVPLLAQIPLDPIMREGGDAGTPIVDAAPDQPAAQALSSLAETVAKRGRGLLGRQLGLAPVAG